MSFGKSVAMAGGPYLIIEHTEALHVIDVNSGNRQNRKADTTDYALNVNVESAKEIARQLRLRDMGGIIVIDFIDLRNPAHKKTLLMELKKAMANDPAKHTILPMSKFGLIQITRQRVRPETNITTAETCPMCKGEGKVEASILLTDEIEHKLDQILSFSKPKKIELVAHPFVEAFLTKGVVGKSWKWFLKHKIKVKVTADPNYHYGEYHFFDSNDEEIVV
jgi:ribonuclease G